MRSDQLKELKNCEVFLDFDNTITSFDVLDDIIQRFSINRDWEDYEKRWKEGKIGAKECLKGQLKSIRITKEAMAKYVSTIKLDPFFHKLMVMLKKRGIHPVILSDSFSLIIRGILRNNGIKGIRVCANTVRFLKDRLIPSFPHTDRNCPRCAHCKKIHLFKEDVKNKYKIYVGDGLSDICPAEHSDMVFAKGSLWRYLQEKEKPCVGFKNLEDVYHYLEN